MDPIAANCRLDYMPAAHTSGARAISEIVWIVLHDEEAPSAKSAATWFQNPASGGSAHLALDDQTCYRCLPDDAVAWGAPGANAQGFHIEQAGYARWSTVLWKSHLNTLRRAAYKTALHCLKFNIPPRFVQADGLKRGEKGITTHAQVSKAFGGTHWDPGPGWPTWLFMALVRRYYKALA